MGNGRKKNGGAGRGQGRPKGAANLLTRKRANEYASDGGILPLDVMMGNMRFWYNETERLTEKLIAIANTPNLTPDEKKAAMKTMGAFLSARDKAQDCARDAAPYVHPRLAALVPKDFDDNKLPPVEFEVTFTEVIEQPKASPMSVADDIEEAPTVGTQLIAAE